VRLFVCSSSRVRKARSDKAEGQQQPSETTKPAEPMTRRGPWCDLAVLVVNASPVAHPLPRLTSQSVLSRHVPSYPRAPPSCRNCNGRSRFLVVSSRLKVAPPARIELLTLALGKPWSRPPHSSPFDAPQKENPGPHNVGPRVFNIPSRSAAERGRNAPLRQDFSKRDQPKERSSATSATLKRRHIPVGLHRSRRESDALAHWQ
jgi:hypothetical protein